MKNLVRLVPSVSSVNVGGGDIIRRDHSVLTSGLDSHIAPKHGQRRGGTGSALSCRADLSLAVTVCGVMELVR